MTPPLARSYRKVRQSESKVARPKQIDRDFRRWHIAGVQPRKRRDTIARDARVTPMFEKKRVSHR